MAATRRVEGAPAAARARTKTRSMDSSRFGNETCASKSLVCSRYSRGTHVHFAWWNIFGTANKCEVKWAHCFRMRIAWKPTMGHGVARMGRYRERAASPSFRQHIWLRRWMARVVAITVALNVANVMTWLSDDAVRTYSTCVSIRGRP